MAAAILAAGLVLAALIAPESARADFNPWAKSGEEVLITGPFRLILVFTDQSGVPRNALVPSLSAVALAGMPGGLEKASAAAMFQAQGSEYFDGLWSKMRDAVCADVGHEILQFVNHSPNSAYDVQPCRMNPRGAVIATFQTGWTNDQFQSVTGRRVMFHYIVPLNAVTFWVTSPHTCNRHKSCPTEPTDPQFTVVFTADLTATCTPMPGAAQNAFGLPIACTPTTSVVSEGVLGGDVTRQLQAAAIKWAASLPAQAAGAVASGGVGLTGLLASAADLAVKGIGTAIAAVTDQHLRDSVSAWLSILGSGTLNANAGKVSADFGNLFQNLYQAQLGGLKGFAVGIGAGRSFDFGMVYPPPAKPVLQNTIAKANAGSIFSPTIAVAQPEVQPGQTVAVTASYFRGTYANALNIGWNKTVLGTEQTEVDWGPPPEKRSVGTQTLQVANLNPGTAYAFRAHECDGLTCAPWSDVLKTTTEPAGAVQVRFWLDANTNQIIGSAAVGATGDTFQTKVTIPAATAPGPHTLNAAQGKLQASVPITVCAGGACAATLGMVNTSNNTLYPPGFNVEVSLPVTLRGSRFKPGGLVAMFVDTMSGAKLCMAKVGPLGNAQCNFKMPLVAAGPHKFLAVEGPAAPGGKQASVAVFVQAMAQ